VSQCLCHTVCVTLSVSQCLCHSVCVTLSIAPDDSLLQKRPSRWRCPCLYRSVYMCVCVCVTVSVSYVCVVPNDSFLQKTPNYSSNLTKCVFLFEILKNGSIPEQYSKSHAYPPLPLPLHTTPHSYCLDRTKSRRWSSKCASAKQTCSIL